MEHTDIMKRVTMWHRIYTHIVTYIHLEDDLDIIISNSSQVPLYEQIENQIKSKL